MRSNHTLVLSSRTIGSFDEIMYAFAKDNGWNVSISSFMPRGGAPIPAWLSSATVEPQEIVSSIEPGVFIPDARAAHNYLFNTKRKSRDHELRQFQLAYGTFIEANKIRRFRGLMAMAEFNNNPVVECVVVHNSSVRIDISFGRLGCETLLKLAQELGVGLDNVELHFGRTYDDSIIVKNISPQTIAEFNLRLSHT